ncbi:hypothetical protein QTP86_034556, partial [Hemibagrus guttatus]
MMFADDIVICSESREQVEENLQRWRFALERRGMKVSRSKTEYMCVNEREGSGTVRLQGEEVKKVQEFKYMGSTVQSNGECGKEVKKRVQAAHSTETALLAVTEQLHAARSAKLSSVLIPLHLSAAFDTVNHKTLLSTLRSLGICGTAWEWFASYLDGRSYQVTWKRLTSAPYRLSVMARRKKPDPFAEPAIGKEQKSYPEKQAESRQQESSNPKRQTRKDTTASARISACLVDISSWMTAHQLKLNPSKTELLVIP